MRAELPVNGVCHRIRFICRCDPGIICSQYPLHRKFLPLPHTCIALFTIEIAQCRMRHTRRSAPGLDLPPTQILEAHVDERVIEFFLGELGPV